jgi:glycosyltransferase involved in cell wall biosynthesis
MRVLQLGPYPPPHGGVQTNLVAIRRFLRKQQIPCFAINITRHRKIDADEVYYPHNTLDLLSLLLRLRYNIVHLHIGGMLTTRLLGLAYVCSAIPGTKSVLTFHSGGYPSSAQGRTAGPRSLAAFVFRRMDGLIAVNEQILSFFHKLGIPQNRARLIPPYALLEEDVAAKLSAPLEQFFAQHHPVLISVGLLEPEYDLNLQISVLESLLLSFPRAGLLIIGSGSLEGELGRAIQSKAYASHILLSGDVAHDITMLAIRRSDVMLRTTLYDGDAVSVREALFLGTPVIATDNGMRPMGVRLIPRSDIEALRQAVMNLLGQPESICDSRTPDENNLQAVLDFYRELLG